MNITKSVRSITEDEFQQVLAKASPVERVLLQSARGGVIELYENEMAPEGAMLVGNTKRVKEV